jgi:hypothetical protein
MATPGDPYEDQSIDEWRHKQRRVLWALPEVHKLEAVAAVDARPDALPGASRRPLVERGLRRLADAEIDALGSDKITSWMDRAASEALSDWFIAAFPGEVEPDPFARTKALARRQARLAGDAVDQLEKSEHQTVAYRLAMYLIWADRCAGDDYEDPGVADLRRAPAADG